MCLFWKWRHLFRSSSLALLGIPHALGTSIHGSSGAAPNAPSNVSLFWDGHGAGACYLAQSGIPGLNSKPSCLNFPSSWMAVHASIRDTGLSSCTWQGTMALLELVCAWASGHRGRSSGSAWTALVRKQKFYKCLRKRLTKSKLSLVQMCFGTGSHVTNSKEIRENWKKT